MYVMLWLIILWLLQVAEPASADGLRVREGVAARRAGAESLAII